MKNVHLITKQQKENVDILPQHIYITSEEEPKDGEWAIATEGIWKNTIIKITGTPITDVWRKIILTTDPDLIKDGVQPIDNEFLEWFVKNPSCEFVEVSYEVLKPFQSIDKGYILRLPDTDVLEEPKQIKCYCGHTITCDCEPLQETLEEASHTAWLNYEHVEGNLYSTSFKNGFKFGAKWQAQRIGLMEIELNHTKTLLASCEKALENRDNNKQQTAVEWLIQEIESKGDAWENASIKKIQISIDASEYAELKAQAKEMEKQQIINAFDGFPLIARNSQNGEEYYNKTYKTKKP
jgi:hypothetical protein